VQKRHYRKYLNAVFLIAVFALTIRSVFHGEDLAQMWNYLQAANFAYIWPSIACVILFIIGESTVIAYLLSSLSIRVAFGHCCLYSFIGFFYSCITPSASGGQPMQIIAMRKDKVPVAVSTVVLAIVTITYKLVLVLLGLTVIIWEPDSIMQHLDGVEWLIYLGLALNIGCIIILLLLVFHPGLVRGGAKKTLAFINRIRPFKNPQRLHDRLEKTISQYTGTADYYRTHKGMIVIVFLITLLQRMLLFAVTWFAYRALGLQGENPLNILLLQGMIAVAVDMLPLPGGMGISENLFLMMFLPIFGAELILPGMVISRGISYYTQLLLSAVMTIAAAFIIRKKD